MANRNPLETLAADLVVVGGGLAGTCLALAAARHGTETMLVHDRPVLGGNSSSEVRVVPAGASHYNAWARETGIIEELLVEDRARNHQQFFENGLTNSGWDLTLLEAAHRESCLTVLLNSSVREVELIPDGGRPTIRAVHASQLTTGRELRITGRHFADCTGDGTLAYLAGADWRYGREARAEHDEPLAPVAPDRVTSGSTLSLHARDVGRPVPFTAPEWIEPYRRAEDLGLRRELRSTMQPEFGGFWWLEVGTPYDQVTDTELVRDELLRHLLGVWNYLKNHHPDKRHWETYALDWFGMLPGKRESRRVLGDVILAEGDCHTDRAWPDRVGYGGWYLDLHTDGGILNRSRPGEPSFLDENYRYWTRVAPYSVPLRSLYSRSLTNLWLGGRCLSATHIALGTLRVQQTLAALGHATGIAASMALTRGLQPRQLATGTPQLLAELRQRLLRDDVRILGTRNTDPTDLARAATCTASSTAALCLERPSGDHRLIGEGRAQVIPLTSEHLRGIALHLANPAPAPASAIVTLSRLNTIWDQDSGVELGQYTIELPPGYAGWKQLDLGALKIESPAPHRVAVTGTPTLKWSLADELPTGVVAQYRHCSSGGPQPDNADLELFSAASLLLPAHQMWAQDRGIAHCLRTSPPQRPFEAHNVVNGRAWPEDLPNLWASDPADGLPQHLTLTFPQPIRFDTVILTFDTDLDLKLGRAPGLWRAPQCARTIRLHSRYAPDHPWEVVHTIAGNYQRRSTIRLAQPQDATELRFEILDANSPEADTEGSWQPSARLFEIRIYGPRRTRVSPQTPNAAPLNSTQGLDH